MDITLVAIKVNSSNNIEIEYAGANRPLYLIRNNVFEEIKATKKPIGGIQIDEQRIYENHQFTLAKNDIFYLTSDGYADQFGGEKGKKMTTKRFKEYLQEISSLNMPTQQEKLDSFFQNWKGDNEQVDDVCVIGVRV